MVKKSKKSVLFAILMISLDNVVGVLMPQQPEYDEAWKKFRDLLPILTCCGLSLKSRGYAYNACERSVLLYASEMWAATQKDVSHLNHNDTMMIGWILSVKLRDKAPSEELRSQLGLGSIENALRCGCLHWYGHVQRMVMQHIENLSFGCEIFLPEENCMVNFNG